MRQISIALVLFTTITCLAASFRATAAGEDYEIQRIAFNSTFLDSEIARRYGITRAENLALVNVSVQRGDVIGVGVPARVTGSANNLMHQVKTLEFREIREENAIYYIAPLRFDDGDTLTFKLDIVIEGETRPRQVQWQQKFWKQ